jgi:phosphoribosyl-AMP cyclohydrolase
MPTALRGHVWDHDAQPVRSTVRQMRDGPTHAHAKPWAWHKSTTGRFPMLDFDKAGGLISAIAQDYRTGEVLMIAWMNAEAYEETVRTGKAVYWSRSRKKLWRKGEESGNVQEVKEIFIDCDADAVLLKVDQIGGAACHEGFKSCFFRRVEKDGSTTTLGERVFDPAKVYGK